MRICFSTSIKRRINFFFYFQQVCFHERESASRKFRKINTPGTTTHRTLNYLFTPLDKNFYIVKKKTDNAKAIVNLVRKKTFIRPNSDPFYLLFFFFFFIIRKRKPRARSKTKFFKFKRTLPPLRSIIPCFFLHKEALKAQTIFLAPRRWRIPTSILKLDAFRHPFLSPIAREDEKLFRWWFYFSVYFFFGKCEEYS